MKLSTKLTVSVLLLVLLAAIPVASKEKTKNNTIVLTKDNTISLNDVIDGELVPNVLTKAKELDQSFSLGKLYGKRKEPIYVFVRSPGGEIQLGLEMLEALKGLNRPVDTITSFGASMAFQTVQSLGTRYILKTGVLMSHRAKGGFEGEFGGQKPSQIDSRKDLWESRLNEMDQQTVDRTNGKQTLASYQKAYASELWVTGTQAVEQGYADAVVSVRCDESLSGVTTKTVNFMGIINISYDLDDCPLNSSPMNPRVANILTNRGTKKFEEFLAEGGEFGSACLIAAGANPAKVCAIDTSLTLERVNQLKEQFKSRYENIKDRIVPYGM